MEAQAIQSGDRVIDLASLARTAGAVGGLVAGFLVTWLATGEIGRALAFGAMGLVGGGLMGRLLGRFRYTADGRRMVVKHGPAARPATVAAALSASLPGAIVAWLGCLTILGGPAPSALTGAASLVAGVLTGVLLGVAATRM
jgi:hypothetical protein